MLMKKTKKVFPLLAAGVLLSSLSTSYAQQAAETKKINPDLFAIRYKGVEVKPGGYIAGVLIWRQRNATSDTSTNFGTIPLPGTANYYTTEFRDSARNSRGSVMIKGTEGDVSLRGYLEFDWGAAAPNANESQSNSFSPRMRQGYAEARYQDKWYVLAGQAWSLLISNREGIDPEHLAIPLTIDNQVLPGFTYARQTALRVTRKWNPRYAAAFAIENPESNASFGANVTALSTVTYNSAGSAFLGNSVNYSTDVAPDVVLKGSVDGKLGHVEVKEITRFFRDRITPTGATQAKGSYNSTKVGAAFGAFGLLHVLPNKVDVMAQGIYGTVGRYAGAGSMVDVTFRPDGTMAPLKAIQGWGGLEYRYSPKLILFGYEGGDYLDRVTYKEANGTALGYGNPNSTGTSFDNRLVYATSVGYAYTFFYGAIGSFQTDTVYTYIGRSTWRNLSGAPKANDNTAMVRVRYILP
jgi:hypothetical protein